MTRRTKEMTTQSHSVGGSDNSIAKAVVAGDMTNVSTTISIYETTIRNHIYYNSVVTPDIQTNEKNNESISVENDDSLSSLEALMSFKDAKVNVNGTQVTLGESTSVLGKCCDNFTLLNIEEDRKTLNKIRPYDFYGSMTRLKYCGKRIGLSTRCQTFCDGHDRQKDVCTNYYPSGELASIHYGTGIVHVDDQYQTGRNDQTNICLFDFTTNAGEHNENPEFENMFFDLNEKDTLRDSDDVLFYATIGCFGNDQSNLIFDKSGRRMHVDLNKKQFWCSPRRHSNRFLGKCKNLIPHNPSVDYSGMEGSPVFAFILDRSVGIITKFAGINIQTESWNEEEFDFIKASDIKYLLDNMVEEIEEQERGNWSISVLTPIAVIICNNKDIEKTEHVDCIITAKKSHPKDVNIGKAVSILKNNKGLDIELKHLCGSKAKGTVSVIPSSLRKSIFPRHIRRKGNLYIFEILDNTPALSLDGFKRTTSTTLNPGEFYIGS